MGPCASCEKVGSDINNSGTRRIGGNASRDRKDLRQNSYPEIARRSPKAILTSAGPPSFPPGPLLDPLETLSSFVLRSVKRWPCKGLIRPFKARPRPYHTSKELKRLYNALQYEALCRAHPKVV